MTYSFRPRNRFKLLTWKAENVGAIHSIIKTLPTIEQKWELVGNTNPLLYIFGRNLSTKHPYKEYADGQD